VEAGESPAEAGSEMAAVDWVHPDEVDPASLYPNHERILRTAWEQFGDG